MKLSSLVVLSAQLGCPYAGTIAAVIPIVEPLYRSAHMQILALVNKASVVPTGHKLVQLCAERCSLS
jgi:hypothetical protein